MRVKIFIDFWNFQLAWNKFPRQRTRGEDSLEP